jgi:hypothetical protein
LIDRESECIVSFDEVVTDIKFYAISIVTQIAGESRELFVVYGERCDAIIGIERKYSFGGIFDRNSKCVDILLVVVVGSKKTII